MTKYAAYPPSTCPCPACSPCSSSSYRYKRDAYLALTTYYLLRLTYSLPLTTEYRYKRGAYLALTTYSLLPTPYYLLLTTDY